MQAQLKQKQQMHNQKQQQIRLAGILPAAGNNTLCVIALPILPDACLLEPCTIYNVMTAVVIQLYCASDILLVPMLVSQLLPFCYPAVNILLPSCYIAGYNCSRLKVSPLFHHSVIKLVPGWYQPVTKFKSWFGAVQGLRMALCVCGIAPPTGWKTTSTTAWSASGLWPTSRAPTSKHLTPTLCSAPLFWLIRKDGIGLPARSSASLSCFKEGTNPSLPPHPFPSLRPPSPPPQHLC